MNLIFKLSLFIANLLHSKAVQQHNLQIQSMLISLWSLIWSRKVRDSSEGRRQSSCGTKLRRKNNLTLCWAQDGAHEKFCTAESQIRFCCKKKFNLIIPALIIKILCSCLYQIIIQYWTLKTHPPVSSIRVFKPRFMFPPRDKSNPLWKACSSRFFWGEGEDEHRLQTGTISLRFSIPLLHVYHEINTPNYTVLILNLTTWKFLRHRVQRQQRQRRSHDYCAYSYTSVRIVCADM